MLKKINNSTRRRGMIMISLVSFVSFIIFFGGGLSVSLSVADAQHRAVISI